MKLDKNTVVGAIELLVGVALVWHGYKRVF
jgi:hypothetical protein